MGAVSLRAIELEPRGKDLSLRHWTHQTVTPPEEDNQANLSEATMPALARVQLNGKGGFTSGQLVTSLGPPDVEICSLQVPETLLSQNQKSLINGIRHEVGRHVNARLETAELTAWPIVPGHADGPNLLVAAVARTLIEQLLAWVRAQGRVCTRIDLDPLAMMRGCARMMEDLPEDQLWAILDIGFRSSRLYLGIGEVPVYVRSLRASGDLMTRRIANELSVDLAQAERYKRHYGIGAEGGNYRPFVADQGPVNDRRMANILLGALTPIVQGMAQDIEKSFRYAMHLYPDRSVYGLVLAGGGGNLEGLPELLADMLGIKVRRASAERLLSAGNGQSLLKDEALAGMVTCLGLGYGEFHP